MDKKKLTISMRKNSSPKQVNSPVLTFISKDGYYYFKVRSIVEDALLDEFLMINNSNDLEEFLYLKGICEYFNFR